MSITRSTDTDDDGTGTTGTIRTNAWLQAIYDVLDARWSRATVTSTGTQTTVSFSEADLILFNNASDLTIRSLTAPASPAKPGKRLYLASIGAGNVFLNHQDTTGTTAANRMINLATSATTPLAAGSGTAIYVYDDNASRWRLVHHDQGAYITPTFAAGNYTASGSGTWTVGSGDVTTQQYHLRGRKLSVKASIATTTVAQSGGDPTSLRISNSAWGGFTSTDAQLFPAVANDNAAGNQFGVAQVTAAGTLIATFRAATAQWSNSTDNTHVHFEIAFQVT